MSRAPRGQRAYGTAPGHWHRLTVLGALALSGLVCAMTVPAATDWPMFQAFLQHVLIPCLRQHKPGAIVVMDHLAVLASPQARALLGKQPASRCCPCRATPPTSSIELCWSKLKTPLRTAEPRSIAAIEEQIDPGPRHHHLPGCQGLVSPLRISSINLTQKPL